MKKTSYLLLFIFLNTSFLFSQNNIENHETAYDSITHKKVYRVGFSSIHTVELIELKNGNYTGHLINVLTRYNRKRTKDFVQKIRIPESTVEQLMSDLQKLQIETLEKCGDFLSPEYDCISSLDGDGTWFEVVTDHIKRKYWFDALVLGRKESLNLPQKQKTAQQMLNLINDTFALKKTLHKFMKHLPSGTYGYYGVSWIKLS